MTEQTSDSADERLREEQNAAAGASRWVAPAAGSSRPAKDLVAACEQLLSGGARQLDSAALRDALLDLHDFWLNTKATEIGITATSGFAIVATGGLRSEEQNAAAGASRWVAPAAGSSRPAKDLVAACEQLLSGGARQLDSAALRDALLDLHDFWLNTKATEIGITATSGFAIVATGGL